MIQDYGQDVLGTHGARKAIAVMPPLSKTEGPRDVERDGWWRTMSASLAFLKWAHLRLQDAEIKITAQEKRIHELEQLATRDELTGLLNRRGFGEMFAREMDRTRRGHSEGGLMVMIDLDNFKAINDLYSHAAGDAALRLVARTLENNSRVMDGCARLGGDEFILLLTNTDREKCLARAQNLIRQLNNLSLVWYGAEIPVRASLGLKEYKPGDTVESVLGDADTLMYANKNARKGLEHKAATRA
jgi:diguanylate cyclase (GGDEF)-like protein